MIAGCGFAMMAMALADKRCEWRHSSCSTGGPVERDTTIRFHGIYPASREFYRITDIAWSMRRLDVVYL